MNLQESIRQDLLKFEGFRDEVNEEGEDSFTFNRDGKTEEYKLSDHDKYIINVLAKLRAMYSDLKAHGVELEVHGSSGTAMDELYTDVMYELGKYVRYYMKIPALDGGEYDHSHPYLG